MYKQSVGILAKFGVVSDIHSVTVASDTKLAKLVVVELNYAVDEIDKLQL